MKHPKVILITGATSGLGKALAVEYARMFDSVTLLITGRDKGRLKQVAGECKDNGAEVFIKTIDVRDENELSEWILEMDSKRPVDLLIANAGISGGTGGEIDSEPEKQVKEIFDINVRGAINTISPIIPRMLSRKKGQIAIMSSLASFSGWPGAPAYSASKASVRYYGEALHGALSNQGVDVSIICPGFVKTPLTAVNDFKMPFIMDVDPAAKIIILGLQKRKVRIAFPFISYVFAGMLGALPVNIAVKLLKKLPQKPSNGK
jgi:short-subunit dehydrogenase